MKRRNFIKKTVAGATTLSLGGMLPGFSNRSYHNIIGANERVNVSIMGVNSRGLALSECFATMKNSHVAHICDVDSRAINRTVDKVHNITGNKPIGFIDFRKSLESKDIDALVIAAPDHWHVPASIMALKAGKHVYVEKPLSHNPAEGELLVNAVKKYGLVLQMGNHRRSYKNVKQAINEIKSGVVGKIYFGKAWYANTRGSIGIGRQSAVPEWLDWNLWQGPAPHRDYRDNYVHYNWHWFWHWGTGEALNNGTHMVDLLRWGLGVDYPFRVNSAGGRYQYNDDQETPDYQVISMDFKDDKSLCWEGRSCNGLPIYNNNRGAIFFGENGSLLIHGGDAYTIFDLKGKVIKDVKNNQKDNVYDLTNSNTALSIPHTQNFCNAIRLKEEVHSDVVNSHKSTLLVQLGNIAHRMGHSIRIDPLNGHIIHNKEGMKFWSRTYENGWEMDI